MISVVGRLRRLALAVCLAYGAAVGAAAGAAVELPSGSSNFTPPNHVPNYFSNETAPFRGTSGGQTASPGASPVVAVPGAAERSVASGRAARQYSVQAGRHRARLARGKAGRHGNQVAHARVSRAGKAAVARNTSTRKAIASTRRAAPAKAHGTKTQGRTQRVARARG